MHSYLLLSIIDTKKKFSIYNLDLVFGELKVFLFISFQKTYVKLIIRRKEIDFKKLRFTECVAAHYNSWFDRPLFIKWSTTAFKLFTDDTFSFCSCLRSHYLLFTYKHCPNQPVFYKNNLSLRIHIIIFDVNSSFSTSTKVQGWMFVRCSVNDLLIRHIRSANLLMKSILFFISKIAGLIAKFFVICFL